MYKIRKERELLCEKNLDKNGELIEIVNSCELYEPKYFEYISLIKDINNRIFTAEENSRILSLSNNIRNY